MDEYTSSAFALIVAMIVSLVAGVFIGLQIQIRKDTSLGIVKRADKCINGYIWKSNFKNTMYYQYQNFGKPVKCFILKKR